MLLFDATGTKGGALPRKLQDDLVQAAYHYAKQLKLNRFNGIVNIKVPRKKGYIDGAVGGYCSADRFEHQDGNKYWQVDIDLANVTKVEMIKNLAHEMIHAKQFLKKELSTHMDTWKGIKFETEDGTGFNLDSPWEVEAYSSENELYENYINDGGHYGRRK